MFSYGPPHMAKQKQWDHLEPTYSSSVRIRDVAQRTCQKRWAIGRSGERGSASVLLCPVVGCSRPAVIACRTVRSGVFHHWIHYLWPQGAVPPGFNPLRRGWVYRPAPEAPRKGECRRGPRHFWNCPSCWPSALRRDPP